MNYFIFNYSTDIHLIDSFLRSAALAHGHKEVKSEEWFMWKFKHNPFGEAILACAEENGEIVGCVAYGIQPFWLKGKVITGSLAFESFVHPQYQRKGIFKKLISLSEKETKMRGIEILFAFPNSNSLPGFERMNWTRLSISEYWIKGASIFTIALNLTGIRQGFKPNPSNLQILNIPTNFQQKPQENLTSVITLEYLKWRFFTHPVAEYIIIDTEELYSVIRMGNRGKIREGQVLFIHIKNERKFKMSTFIAKCQQASQYDILSFPISKNNSIREYLKKAMFLKVPNKTNICYKILNTDGIQDDDVLKISLSAINYHTY